MRRIPLQQNGVLASRLILGCMAMGGERNIAPITMNDIKEARMIMNSALQIGINMFDHADIYKLGKAEQVFGSVLREIPSLRESIIIQSKCGIRPKEWTGLPFKRYDFAKEHILTSVDGILERLGIEYLDILLLHRPDPLMDPEEVAAAIQALKSSGKVRRFGVSNMSAGQIRLLQSYCDERFIVNQLEMSLQQIGWLEAGILVNHEAGKDLIFPEGTLEYCRLENIQLQAWGALAQGAYSGNAQRSEDHRVWKTAQYVRELSIQKETAAEAIVLAWLMKHPAGIQPIIGTSKPERIEACGQAIHISLTSDEWYGLYTSSRGGEVT